MNLKTYGKGLEEREKLNESHNAYKKDKIFLILTQALTQE